MRNLRLFTVGLMLLFVMGWSLILPAAAQQECDEPEVWTVEDNTWLGTWTQVGSSNSYTGLWERYDEQDFEGSLVITTLPDGAVSISRIDGTNRFVTYTCEYSGAISDDRTSASGTGTCLGSYGTIDFTWSASISCGGKSTITWDASARNLTGQLGTFYTYTCPPNGTAYRLWGQDYYTDDSSICTAAVHAGLITLESGGDVTIQLYEGLDSYLASERNGISSSSFGGWARSYTFYGLNAGAPFTHIIGWTTNAVVYRGEIGAIYDFTCPLKGTTFQPWGTDIYTDDSSICSAAVHSGLITVEGGGRVRIQILAGEDKYLGSTQNGITSKDYGKWDGSYRFVS